MDLKCFYQNYGKSNVGLALRFKMQREKMNNLIENFERDGSMTTVKKQ